MGNNASQVSAAKPQVGGAIHTAPQGTALPADATTTLSAAFKCLGYISEDGVTNSSSPESEEIKAWGGDTVLTVTTSKSDTYQVTLIESLNPDVLKSVYGDENVTGDIDTGLTIKHNSAELSPHVWVFDMIMNGGILKRIVIPNGKVSEVGDIVYTGGEAVGYETTIAAAPDASGNTAYEYIEKPGSGGSGEE